MNKASKTQIDRLGERLKKGGFDEADLRLLDDYRRSFADVYEHVVGRIRSELSLEPTGRPAKSTSSIQEKLLRESIRLTQIQDIAGCRLVVPDIVRQDQVVSLLKKLFDNVTPIDRRERPSHGYRAVHLVVQYSDKLVEIQVRTSFQHLWAGLSEKLSDTLDPAIKYGGGDEQTQGTLEEASKLVASMERSELELARTETQLSNVLSQAGLTEEAQQVVNKFRQSIEERRKNLISIRQQFSEQTGKAIEILANLRRK
jgi:ppGpp synthetase/RelA/SpoT-type nucleotidyltranferase